MVWIEVIHLIWSRKIDFPLARLVGYANEEIKRNMNFFERKKNAIHSNE